MKILGNYFSMQVNKPAKNLKSKSVNAAESKKTSQIADSIIITSNRESVAPANFTSMLKARLSEKIREEKSEEQLNLIADKIAGGNYKIDADEIAKKMMLRG
ncbi:MAG: hypothetical protein ACTTH0_06075 [Eubacteriales bacterium]